MRTRVLIALGGLSVAAACSPDTTTSPAPHDPSTASEVTSALPDEAALLRGLHAGAVYTLGNEVSGNTVLLFPRSADGSLGPPETFPTGGAGSGSGLGNQGALILSQDGRWLIAVNPGTNDVSVFRVGQLGLELTSRTPSGGVLPISVTLHRRLLYVLNDGGTANISGFLLGNDGSLTPLPGSTRQLSQAAPDAAQIQFSPDGDVLVVTEKATNQIVTFQVNGLGVAGGPQAQPSVGQTPFGFDFDPRGPLIVSEAFGGAPDASATSSYAVSPTGQLTAISPSVGTTETANCWVVVTDNGRFAYVTNTGSGTISGYAVGNNGSLTLLGDGQSGITGPGSAPIDAALTRGSGFLYVLNSGNQTISAFHPRSDGSLENVPGASGLPTAANGLVAW